MTSATPRFAVAAFQLAMIQLLEAVGLVDVPLPDVAVNFDGRSSRVDIVRLNDEGHIAEWLGGWSMDPNDVANFGRPVEPPVGVQGTDGPVH